MHRLLDRQRAPKQLLRLRRVAQVDHVAGVDQRSDYLHVLRSVRRLLDRQRALVQLLRPCRVAQVLIVVRFPCCVVASSGNRISSALALSCSSRLDSTRLQCCHTVALRFASRSGTWQRKAVSPNKSLRQPATRIFPRSELRSSRFRNSKKDLLLRVGPSSFCPFLISKLYRRNNFSLRTHPQPTLKKTTCDF